MPLPDEWGRSGSIAAAECPNSWRDLAGQEDELLVRFAPWFEALQVAREEDWVRIDGVRNASPVARA